MSFELYLIELEKKSIKALRKKRSQITFKSIVESWKAFFKMVTHAVNKRLVMH